MLMAQSRSSRVRAVLLVVITGLAVVGITIALVIAFGSPAPARPGQYLTLHFALWSPRTSDPRGIS